MRDKHGLPRSEGHDEPLVTAAIVVAAMAFLVWVATRAN